MLEKDSVGSNMVSNIGLQLLLLLPPVLPAASIKGRLRLQHRRYMHFLELVQAGPANIGALGKHHVRILHVQMAFCQIAFQPPPLKQTDALLQVFFAEN